MAKNIGSYGKLIYLSSWDGNSKHELRMCKEEQVVIQNEFQIAVNVNKRRKKVFFLVTKS